MTILQAVTQLDERRHNSCTLEEKLLWLSRLDGKVSRLILERYEGECRPFVGYSIDTPGDTELLIGAPFDEVYLYWLEAQVCYAEGEIADYNSAIAQYNRLYGSFEADYRRNHMPKSACRRFLF